MHLSSSLAQSHTGNSVVASAPLSLRLHCWATSPLPALWMYSVFRTDLPVSTLAPLHSALNTTARWTFSKSKSQHTTLLLEILQRFHLPESKGQRHPRVVLRGRLAHLRFRSHPLPPSPCRLHPNHAGLFAFFRTLGAFAFAVSSAWTLPQIATKSALIQFGSLLKCLLIHDGFSDHPISSDP